MSARSETTNGMVIVAGGSGLRMKHRDKPKQFWPFGGKTLIEHTVLHLSKLIEPVMTVVVVPQEYEKHTKNMFSKYSQVQVVAGGKTRQESVFQGLEILKSSGIGVVYIHDSVRPFVSADLIAGLEQKIKKHQAVIPVIPIAETVVSVDAQMKMTVVDRSQLRLVQTPQVFMFQNIYKAHQLAREQNKHDFTDDASLIRWLEQPVATVMGEKQNIKVTLIEDYEWALWYNKQFFKKVYSSQ